MKWDQSLSVGVDLLDKQHENLMTINDRVEALFKAAFEGDGNYAEALAVLQSLNDFAKSHFEEEERYMASIGFPMKEAHALEHQNFIRYLEAIHLDRLKESPEEVLLELFAFLSEWIIDHIRDKDFRYKAYVEKPLARF